MSPIERIVFRKVELWVVLLLVLLGGCVSYAMIVLTADAASGAGHFGITSKRVLKLAKAPLRILQQFKARDDLQAREQRFGQRAGWLSGPEFNADGLSHVLLSRYSGDDERSVVELMDEVTGEIVHRWLPDIDAINARSNLNPRVVNLARDFSLRRYLIIHPIGTPDGGIIFASMGTPLVRVDACSQVEWTLDGLFHHAIELDGDGNIWVGGRRKPTPFSKEWADGRFLDDEITQVSPNGEILLRKSVAQILIDNGLQHLLRGLADYHFDPIHLNDIQPVITDGPYWRRGDLFLSLRHLSMIVLYRPETNAIIWQRMGPWVRQHDVDIISPTQISVFNNNKLARRGNQDEVEPSNELIVYDLLNDAPGSLLREVFEELDIRTISEGRGTLLGNGDLFIEETNYGRVLRMAANGSLRWEYINRAADGRNYRMNWSRHVSSAHWVQSVLKAARDCAPKG